MMKLKSKLSLVILMILSFVIMLGAASSLIIRANAASAQDGPVQIQSTKTSWYEISYDDDSLTILLDANLNSYSDLSKADLVNLKNALTDAFGTLVIDKLLETGSEQPVAIARSAGAPKAIALDESVLGKYADKLKDRLTQQGDDGIYEFQKYLNGEYDSVIKYAVSQYMDEHKDVLGSELTDKIEAAVKEVEDIVNGIIDNLVEEEKISSDQASTYKSKNEEKGGKIAEDITEVVENGGKVTLSASEILGLLRELTINDIVVFNNTYFHISAIKELLATLPKPSEIAKASDSEMRLSYDIKLDTTMGATEFEITVGFKGDCTEIRNAAQFIADHIDIVKENGVYNVSVVLPDEASALFAKFANSKSIPDEVKHSVFALFSKTGNECLDELKGFTYDDLLDYIKGTDFRTIFASLLDAEKLKSYFSGYNVDVSKLTDENIDKLINDVFKYLEKIANKQDVEGVEEFLSGFGISGLPEKMKDAVQNFLDLLNNIDYEYWNSEKVREFINDETVFNSKFDSLIKNASLNADTRKIYKKFVDLAQRLFDKLPEGLKNDSILGLYNGDGEFSRSGDLTIDVKSILSKLINKITPYLDENNAIGDYADKVQDLIDTWFDGEMTYNVNLSFNMTTSNIYKVEYSVGDKVVKAGMLPVGADVNFYAELDEVDGYKVIAWADSDKNIYPEMPAKDVMLYAVTEFDAIIYNGEKEAEDIEKVFDGDSVVLTAEMGYGSVMPDSQFTYQWYKDGKAIEDATEAELSLTYVKDSGSYYCAVTLAMAGSEEFTVESQSVVVTIDKVIVDMSLGKWKLDKTKDYYVYDGTDKSVSFVLPEDFNLPEVVTYKVMNSTNKEAGCYYAYIAVENSDPDNYEVKLPKVGFDEENGFEWKISPVEIIFTEVPTLSLSTLVYDGEEHVAEVLYKTNVDEGILVYTVDNESNLKQTNAGKYTVKITLSVGDEYANNYVYNGSKDFTRSWQITPVEVKLTEAPALSQYSFIYNGEEQVVEWSFTSNVDDGILVGTIDKPENLAQTNVGTYSVVITLAIGEDYVGNYVYNGVTKFTRSWKITPAEIIFTEAPALDIKDSIVYDGKEHTVSLTYKVNVADGILVYEVDRPENLTQINAGTYNVVAKFSIAEEYAKNYVFNGVSEYNFFWNIKKAALNLYDSYWAYGEGNSRYEADRLTYDGTEQSVHFELVAGRGQTLPEDITVKSYTGNNTATDVGNYTTTAVIDFGSAQDNYVIEGPVNLTLKWSIAQGRLNLNGVAWDYSQAFEFDGLEKEVKLTADAESKLPEGVEFVYSGNKAINAGIYSASVGIQGDNSGNYYIINGPSELTWTIKKAQLSLSSYEWHWSAEKFTYEAGTVREVVLSDRNLEEKLEFVRYNGNRQASAGVYIARAYFKVKDEYVMNYELAGEDYIEYSWSIENALSGDNKDYKERVFTVGDATITASGYVDDKTWNTLYVEEVTNNYTSEQFNLWVKKGTRAEILKVYSISMSLPANFDGIITIAVTYAGFEGTDPITVHVPSGTSEINKDTCNALSTSLRENTVLFNTSSFSDFVVVNQVENGHASLWWVWVLVVIILILLAIIIFLLIVLFKKKKEDEPEEVNDEVILETPELVVEEENADESYDDELEDIDEELDVEDDDNDDADDDGDDSDDETAASGASIAASEAVVSPVNEAEERSRYNKSFTARLCQADDVIKSYYSELKNDILAYKGVKSRISWHFDTFNKGREKCIKLQLRGKSLYMYIALNPADLDEKYHVKDVSGMARYATVPTMLRIRKPRSLKYAKELVAKLMENLGVMRGETPNVQYKIDYKSTEALLQVGLIKIKVSKSNFENINKNEGNN